MAESEKVENKETPFKNMNHDNQNNVILAVVFIVIGLVGLTCFGAATFAFREHKISRNVARNIEIGPRMMRTGRSFGRGMMGEGRAFGAGTARAGVTGVVTSIEGNNLKVKNSSGKEYTVTVSDTTSYTKNGETAKQSDLALNNVVSARGATNSQGQITANFVQIW